MSNKGIDPLVTASVLSMERAMKGHQQRMEANKQTSNLSEWQNAYYRMEENRNQFRDAYTNLGEKHKQVVAELEKAKETIKRYDDLLGDYGCSVMSHRIRIEKLTKVINHFFTLLEEKGVTFDRPWDNPNRIYAGVIQNTIKDLKLLREQRSKEHHERTRFSNTYTFKGFDEQIDRLEALFRKYAFRASDNDTTLTVPSCVDIYVNKNLATEDYPNNPNDKIPPATGYINDPLKP